MFSFVKLITATSLLLSLILPIPTSAATAKPLPPSQDPFYTPPADYTTLPPGTILRQRKLPSIKPTVQLKGVYQILYRTTDALGNASAAVTTVLIPPNANFSRHVAYQTYYDQADPDCSPSYSLQTGSNASTSTVSEIQSVTAAFLQKRLPVSTSDYEGLNSAYTAGPQAAYAVLDSIRAVLASTSLTGILPGAQTGLFGYSGGALASEWATEYAETYAPELKIIGAAMGGMPVNLTSAWQVAGGTTIVGYAFASMTGLSAAYPDFATCLGAALIPAKATKFFTPRSTCTYLPTFSGQKIWSYFTDGIKFLTSDCLTTVVNEAGVMGLHGVPTTFPVYMYKGTKDEIVPTIQQTDAIVQRFCDNGASVEYVRYVNGTHGTTQNTGRQPAINWLLKVMNGTMLPQGCRVTNATIPK